MWLPCGGMVLALPESYSGVENGLKLHRYWTNACWTNALKGRCTTAVQCRITWWEHEERSIDLEFDSPADGSRRHTGWDRYGVRRARMCALGHICGGYQFYLSRALLPDPS